MNLLSAEGTILPFANALLEIKLVVPVASVITMVEAAAAIKIAIALRLNEVLFLVVNL